MPESEPPKPKKSSPEGEDGTTESPKFFRRNVLIGGALTGLAAMGIVGDASPDGRTVASTGGGSMADAIDAHRARRYWLTWDEFQAEDPGVERREVKIHDPGHEKHGTIYEDTGTEWTTAGRQYKQVDMEDLANDDRRDSLPGDTNKILGAVPNQVIGENLRSWSHNPLQLSQLPIRNNRNKARITFRTESARAEDYDDWYPRFKSRGLPWTNGLDWNNLFLDDQEMSVTEALEMAAHGAEIAVYGTDTETRDDLSQMSDEKALETLLGNRRNLEDEGFNIQYHIGRRDEGIQDGETDSAESNLIRSLFIASGSGALEANPNDYTDGANLSAPTTQQYAGRRFSFGESTESEVKTAIDKTIAINGHLDLFAHAHNIGDSGFISWTEVENILDYVVTKRQAGDVEVGTLSGGRLFPHEFDAVNRVPDPLLEGSAQYSPSDYFRIEYNQTAPTVNTDGSGDLTNYLVIGNGNDIRIQAIGMYPHFWCGMFSFQAKAPSTETAELETVGWSANQRFDEFDGSAKTTSRTHSLDDSWTRYFHPFGFHREEDKYHIRILHSSGTVHMGDLKLYPI